VKLREFQAKAVFASRGIRIPPGEVVTTPDHAEAVARRLGGATVLKPQLGVKGRGKVGGIGFSDTAEEARSEAERLLGSDVKGERVEHLLVEAKVVIERELYVAVTVDYAARRPVLVASARGGVDIEEVARTDPEAILTIPASVLGPPSDEALRPVAEELGPEAAEVLRTLHQVFLDTDAELVEVNPLVVTPDGIMAVDGVLNVNEAGADRHPELAEYRAAIPPDDPLSEEARLARWTYIDLGGDIAILSSGAGLTMTIVDLIAQQGATAANFLDTAQIDDEGIFKAFELLRRARPARAWLVNIFAGLNRCDRLAEGIRGYLAAHPLDAPVVVRMVGNLEEEGHRILREAGIKPMRGLEEAVDRVVALSREGGEA